MPSLVVLEDVAEVVTGLHEDLSVSAVVGAVGGLAGGTVVLLVEVGGAALEGVADTGGLVGAAVAAVLGVLLDLDATVLDAVAAGLGAGSPGLVGELAVLLLALVRVADASGGTGAGLAESELPGRQRDGAL